MKSRYVATNDFFNDFHKLKEKMKEHKCTETNNIYESTISNYVMELRTVCCTSGCYTYNIT